LLVKRLFVHCPGNLRSEQVAGTNMMTVHAYAMLGTYREAARVLGVSYEQVRRTVALFCHKVLRYAPSSPHVLYYPEDPKIANGQRPLNPLWGGAQ
jgi:hypothetical protein